jgi:hypothetical protein
MKQKYYALLAYFFYYLGDILWKIICWTDWNEITRKLISAPCWSGYTKATNISLDYDEKAGYVVWKEPTNN